MLNNRIDSTELIRIADAVAAEKSIDKDLVLSSMETAIEKYLRNIITNFKCLDLKNEY